MEDSSCASQDESILVHQGYATHNSALRHSYDIQALAYLSDKEIYRPHTVMKQRQLVEPFDIAAEEFVSFLHSTSG